MKDQYFGDARDYLKYQLLEELMMTCAPSVRQLVCVWMLTASDPSGYGNVPFDDDGRSPALAAFLRRHRDPSDRRVRHLREYFSERGIAYVPWGDAPPYFTNQHRGDYFRRIPTDTLMNAVVFFDPDIGVTTKRPSKAHLSVDELFGVWERMGDSSITVVYQHRDRQPGFPAPRAQELRDALAAPVGWVADRDIALYLAAKSAAAVPTADAVLAAIGSSGRRKFARIA